MESNQPLTTTELKNNFTIPIIQNVVLIHIINNQITNYKHQELYMALTSINFKILSDLQRIDLLNRLIALLLPLASGDEVIEEIIPVLKACVEELKLALAWSAKNELSDRITSTDGIRDDSLSMISGTCRLNRRKSDVAISEAAILLDSIYDDIFDEVSLNNNIEETAAVELFLEKITPQEVVDAITTLQLIGEVDALKTSNPEYIDLVAQREAIKAGDETPRLVPTRRDMYVELKHLMSHMEFKARRGSNFHINMINEMNEPIKAITAVAKAEQTRKENDSQK